MLRIAIALLAAVALAPLAAALDASRVLVVYRADSTLDGDGDGVQDSLEVAQYYAAKRGVPASNLLGVTTHGGDGGFYSGAQWSGFMDDIVRPIRAKLDALGRHDIDVILLSYDMPLGLTEADKCVDNALMALDYLPDSIDMAWFPGLSIPNPYLEANPGFGADNGHFSHDRYNLSSDRGTSDMYLVCRLDGPRGVQGALDLVDLSLYADRYVGTGPGQLSGNAYIDSRGTNGDATDAALAAEPDVISGSYWSYGPSDLNIAYGEHWVAGSGLSLKWQDTDATIGDAGLTYQDGSDASAAPRALFYGGWYNYSNYKDVFDWLPGALACDLDSSSLTWWKVRDPASSNWATRAQAAGATYVCGVSSEPYTTGHPRPHILAASLLHGYCFAEAAGLATPSMVWMSMSLGDPLGAPFAPKPQIADTSAPRLARPPVISGDPAQGATIDLLIDDADGPEVANVRVDYGPTTAYGASFTSGHGYFRRHRLTMPAASASTHVRLTLTDPVGNAATLADVTLGGGSSGPDATPPVISAVGASSITASSATIAWVTDEAADSAIDYGVAAYDRQLPSDGAMSAIHQRTLSGLAAATTYHYRVASRDAVGNLARSADATFTTAAVADLPPVARASATPGGGTAPVTVAFSGAASSDADGSIVAYDWTFGDGAAASGADVSHTYAAPGSYVATLTVRDDAGATGSATATVTVSPAGDGVALIDPGFESPSVGSDAWDAFAYAPTGAGWSFTSGSGVSGNGSGFTAGNPAAPEGRQVGVLQMTSAISQSATFPAGTWVVSFQAAQRQNWQASAQDVQVLVDGAQVALVTPSDTAYRAYQSDPFTVGAGAHEIRFRGLDSQGGDNTAFLDDVRVVAATTAATSSVRLAVDNRYDQLAINGAGVAVGPHDGDWSATDTFTVVGDVRCVALRALNDDPGHWAGLLAKIQQASGAAVGSDATWRVYASTDGGSPPNDGLGRAWTDPAYDDSSWEVPVAQGAYGVAPWYAHDGSAGMDGADWIWAGDPALGVSPIYVRWADTPRGVGMAGPRDPTPRSP